MDIWHFQMIGLQGNKCSFFSCHSKAGWREVRCTITSGPSVPIIICTPLTSTDRVGEQKWPAPQMARENWKKKKFVKLQTFQWVLNMTCGSVLVSPCQELRRKKCDGQTKHNMHININRTTTTLFVCFNNAVKMVMWTHRTVRFWYRYIQNFLLFLYLDLLDTYHACQHTAWINAGLLMRGASFVRLKNSPYLPGCSKNGRLKDKIGPDTIKSSINQFWPIYFV